MDFELEPSQQTRSHGHTLERKTSALPLGTLVQGLSQIFSEASSKHLTNKQNKANHAVILPKKGFSFNYFLKHNYWKLNVESWLDHFSVTPLDMNRFWKHLQVRGFHLKTMHILE